MTRVFSITSAVEASRHRRRSWRLRSRLRLYSSTLAADDFEADIFVRRSSILERSLSFLRVALGVISTALVSTTTVLSTDSITTDLSTDLSFCLSSNNSNTSTLWSSRKVSLSSATTTVPSFLSVLPNVSKLWRESSSSYRLLSFVSTGDGKLSFSFSMLVCVSAEIWILARETFFLRVNLGFGTSLFRILSSHYVIMFDISFRLPRFLRVLLF